MTFNEAKKVKAVEGIPVEEADMLKDIEMADEKKAVRKEEKKEEKMPPES